MECIFKQDISKEENQILLKCVKIVRSLSVQGKVHINKRELSE